MESSLSTLIVPPGYRPLLDPRHTERAIQKIKEAFQTSLAYELNLVRVTAPLFVRAHQGINDDLNGVERPVRFQVGGLGNEEAEIVQSLAKWKRLALADLGFSPGEGLYADMNAVRPDDTMDNIHSLYVDQWDWELALEPEERTRATLERVVRTVYDVIRRTERYICHEYEELLPELPREITIVHALDLARRYPGLSPKERELQLCRDHGAVFIMGIGAPLGDLPPHDGRAPDYDDWTTEIEPGYRGLNGDILVYDAVLDIPLELSSMGIRVDPAALERQLEISGATDRRELYFHRRLLAGELPASIGGGIGQSRLCMFYLRKAHIGEIQSGLWPREMARACQEAGIPLL
ncbi:aspartate-ammonia ligase [Alkalispirochaeta americana]|uniref:Aspartate--ammonia ligase n=1 Tax=Alkalispirochaeta americana TaxID=159291 RepID=A0A1N6Q600_9SPIO|nr:aspartate--ammonia ligase [Alkalispirochaeta americana]SIQ11947.1 aspartate-ammonia ligase [Alkalispirochaeta americana]